MTAVRRTSRRALLRVGVSLVVLTLLVVLLPFDELVAALRRVPPAVGVAGLAVYLCLHLIGVIKWRLLVNSAGAGLSVGQAARCYYAGLFGNTFLPSIVGGDVVRAGVAMTLARSKGGVLLGSVVDRTLDVIALAAVAGLGVALIPGALDPRSRRIFAGLATLFVLGALLLILLAVVVRPRRLSFRMRRRAAKVRGIARSMARQPSAVGAALLMGVTLQTLLVVLNAWLGAACGIDISLRVWLFVWPLAKIAALVPVTQGGIGVREAAQVALFAPFGVPAALALAAGLVFELIIISGGLVGGAIAYLLRRAPGQRSAPPSAPGRAPTGEPGIAPATGLRGGA